MLRSQCLSACGWMVLLCVTAGSSCKKEEEKKPPPAPSLQSISPALGLMAGGTTVTVLGSNLDGASLTVGGTRAVVNTASPGAVVGVTPAGARGPQDVVVTTAGGSATLPLAFRYLEPVTVNTVDPSSIGSVGTTTVVLRGSGLHGPVVVDVVGPSSTQSFTAGAGTEFAVPVALGGLATGTYSLTITNVDMQSTTLPAALTVQASATPQVFTVSPARGLERGGTALRVTGQGFTGATQVTVGGQPAAPFQVGNTGQELVFNAPAGTRGEAAIAVTTPAGTGTLTPGFIYTRAVSISGLVPPQLVEGSAGTVAVRGTGMVGPVRVSLTRNNVPLQLDVRVQSETEVTVDVPVLEAGDYVFTVVNADGESGVAPQALRVRQGFSVTSVRPVGGFTDEPQALEIFGPDLSGATEVLVGTQACTPVVVKTSTRVTCSVPAGAAAGAADVWVKKGTLAEGVLAGGFLWVAPGASGVKVLGVQPAGGRHTGGQSVEVVGTGFTAGATVLLGGQSATVQQLLPGGRRLRVTTPARSLGLTENSVTVDVRVTVGGSSNTLAGGFRYHKQPSVQAANPNKGATVGGDLITVVGEGFTDEGTQVLFDGVLCSDVVVQTPTQLSCRIPRHVLGFADVTVVNEFDESAPAPNAFEYVEAVRIVSTDPALFSIAGGTRVLAQGSGFAPGVMRLTLVEDGTDATEVEVLDGSNLRFVMPGRAQPGTATLRVADTARPGQPFSTGETPVEFVDLTNPKGGVGGGAINRNINVTVLRSDNGARVPSARVFAGPSWVNAFAKATTNAQGMAVVARDPCWDR